MSDYEKEWDWGGIDITKTKKGWVVEGWSRMQGCMTNYRYLVKPWPGMTHDTDLNADWNDWMENGEIIADRAIEQPDKILSKGWRVE